MKAICFVTSVNERGKVTPNSQIWHPKAQPAIYPSAFTKPMLLFSVIAPPR